jgi:hypothetical protein
MDDFESKRLQKAIEKKSVERKSDVETADFKILSIRKVQLGGV